MEGDVNKGCLFCWDPPLHFFHCIVCQRLDDRMLVKRKVLRLGTSGWVYWCRACQDDVWRMRFQILKHLKTSHTGAIDPEKEVENARLLTYFEDPKI